MFVNELFEAEGKQVKVIYPGRFQPFHKGHAQVYQHLCQKFGKDNVYIVTSNKVEMPKSPFSFVEKKAMIGLTGVDTSRVIQDSQPYRAPELVAQFDPANTILLFAISEKDMAEDPRFQFKPKKDGSPSYFQQFTDLKQCQTLDKHGYMITVPTFNFTVLGQPANSASQIREQFAGADLATQRKIVTDLFGKFDNNVFNIMKARLEVSEVTEDDAEEDDDQIFQNIVNTGRDPATVKAMLQRSHARALKIHKGNEKSPGFNAARLSHLGRQAMAEPGKEHLVADVNEDIPTTNKPPRRGTQRWKNAEQRKQWEREHPPVEPGDQMYGTAKIVPKKVEEHGDKWERDQEGNETGWGFKDTDGKQHHQTTNLGLGDTDKALADKWAKLSPEALVKAKARHAAMKKAWGLEEAGRKIPDYGNKKMIAKLNKQWEKRQKNPSEVYFDDDEDTIIYEPTPKRIHIPKTITDPETGEKITNYGNKPAHRIKKEKVTELSPATHAAHAAKRGPHIIPTLMKDVKKGAKMGRAVSKSMEKVKAHNQKSDDDEPNVFTEETNSAEMARLQRQLKKETNPDKKEAIRLNIRKLKGEMELRAKDKVTEEHNPQDTVTFDIPLLIRMLEYAREDAKTDMDLHNVTEKLIRMSASGKTLSMAQYNSIVSPNIQESINRQLNKLTNEAGFPFDVDHMNGPINRDYMKNKKVCPHCNGYRKVYTGATKMAWQNQGGKLIDCPVCLGGRKKVGETIVPGFGEMRPEQVKKEVEGLTAEMLKYAREGNMRAVAEYIKKLQPFVDTAQKTSVTESIDKALRTAKRNAV